MLLPELKWESYNRFLGEVQNLSRQWKWGFERPGAEGGALSREEEESPVGGMEEAFRLELAQRRMLLDEELQLRRQMIAGEMESRLRQRKNHEDYLIRQALEERRRQQTAEFADFKREKEKEYAIKLANFRFKLEIPDLSDEEKSRLTKEIAALEEELAAVLAEKEKACREELEQLAKSRQEAAAAALAAYRRELEAEGQARFVREQQRLEAEFNAWLQQRGANQAFWSETSEEKVLF